MPDRPIPKIPLGGCAETQSVLLEYVTRELDAVRAKWVREHLRQCPDCAPLAVELEAALESLRQVLPRAAELPQHLTAARRARIAWSIQHPVLDWIRRRPKLVALMVALLVVAVLAALLGRVSYLWDAPEPTGYDVTIGQGAPPAKPGPKE